MINMNVYADFLDFFFFQIGEDLALLKFGEKLNKPMNVSAHLFEIGRDSVQSSTISVRMIKSLLI